MLTKNSTRSRRGKTKRMWALAYYDKRGRVALCSCPVFASELDARSASTYGEFAIEVYVPLEVSHGKR